MITFKTFRATPARIAILLALGANATHAAGDLEFLKMVASGAKPIVGESVAKGHEGWTAVDGLSWTIEAPTVPFATDRVLVGKASQPTIRWNQALDSTVPAMYESIVRGTPLDSATFDHVGTGSSSPYMSLGLKDAFFTDLSLSKAGISAALLPQQISLSYTAAAQGQPSHTSSVNWNFATNTGSSAPSIRGIQQVGKGVTPAAAPGGATQAYLRLGDGFSGTSQASGYENWIQVSTAGWDVFAEVSALKGSGAAVGKATSGPLTWTQALDGTLLVSVAQIGAGKALPQVRLEFVKDAGAGPVTFMQLVMNEVYFTSVGVAGLEATQSVVFTSVSETIWKIKADGTRDDRAFVFDYNFGTQTAGNVVRAESLSGFGAGSLSPSSKPLSTVPSQASAVDELSAVAVVPEPETWALVLCGGAVLLSFARRARVV